MGEHEKQCTNTSFLDLLRSLVGETVQVEPTGDSTTIYGKLIRVHTSFITVAVSDGTETPNSGPGTNSVHLYWIPVNRISVISET